MKDKGFSVQVEGNYATINQLARRNTQLKVARPKS